MQNHESQPEYREAVLQSEDRANLFRITSLVNQASREAYPKIPSLGVDQIKIVSNLAETETAIVKSQIHPFFMKRIAEKDIEFYTPGSMSWADGDSNSIFFDEKNIKDMRKNKAVGYLGIGLDLADSSISLGADSVLIKPEYINSITLSLLSMNYKRVLHDLTPESFLNEAILYAVDKGSSIQVKGLELSVMVEGKRFIPSVGIIKNMILNSYLARPVKLGFVELLAQNFNLEPNQKERIINYINSTEGTKEEKLILNEMQELGFNGRDEILAGYRNGNIGKKIIEIIASY